MNISKARTRITKILVMGFLTTALLGGYAQAEYAMHGRVSYDAGNTLVKGAQEADWSNASINTLILAEDTLWVDSGGTAEVEFPGGNFLRMADASKVEVLSIDSTLTLRGWAGSFYVQRTSRSNNDVVLETPAGVIRVGKASNLRVDILEDGATAITVRWGAVTVRAQNGNESNVSAGQRVWVEPGMLPSEAVQFSSSNDDSFDDWNRERAEWLANGPSQTPVQVSDNAIGVTDLSHYGEWVTVDSRSYWRPTVVTEYVPYRHGRWSYTSGIGHVWVGMYPFSYVTTHHGYWDYMPSHGWVWSYHDTWSPAWAATVRYGDNFLWTPVDRYHRPVRVSESAYFNIGGVQFSYHASSYVQSDYLYWGPSRIQSTYGSSFQNIYNSGNVTNVNIWNINTSGDNNQVRVPYEREFAQMSRNYNPSRTIRGTVASPADGGRSARNRASSLESRIGRDSFTVRSRNASGNVRTSVENNRSARGRTVRLQENTPSYLRDARSGRTINAEEVRASVRDREAVPSTRGRGDSVRGGGGSDRSSSDRSTGARGDRSSSDRSDRVTRAPDTDRGNAASGVRSGTTNRTDRGTTSDRGSSSRGNVDRSESSRTSDRGSAGRGNADRSDSNRTPARGSVSRDRDVRDNSERGNVRQQPGATSSPRSSAPDRSTTGRGSSSPNRDRSNGSDARSTTPRGNVERSAPNRSSSNRSTPERSSVRQRVQIDSSPSRSERSQAPSARSNSNSSTSRSSVRSESERPRATQTTPRSTTSQNRSAERSRPQAQSNTRSTPNRSAERSQPQSRSNASSNVRSAPSNNRSSTPSRPQATPERSSSRQAPSSVRSAPSNNRSSAPSANRPSSRSSSSNRSSISSPSSSRPSAPSASSGRSSGGNRSSASITPRSQGGSNRSSASSSRPSAPSRSSGISSRSSAPSRSSGISSRSSGRSSSSGISSGRSSSSRGSTSVSPRSSSGRSAPSRGGR